MVKKPTLTELKKHLSTKSQQELIEEIGVLYKKFDDVKEYYWASYFHDDAQLLEKYKEIIKKEFLPKNKYDLPRARLSVAKKAISDYKKISCSNRNLADIMVFYVEVGVKHTLEFGDIDEPFYESMEKMYEKALQYIVKENLLSIFKPRLAQIVKDTYGIGWGFHDQLAYLYDHYVNRQAM